MSVTINGEPVKQRADRVPSTIQFPYSDISDAIGVAEGLLKGGGMPLSRDQLGAAMGQVPSSGSFNTKVSSARIFGVMEAGGGKYQLTELGHEIVDPMRQREALVAAFLNVELYKRVYDEFRGKRLPPRPHGLEQAFIKMGVSPKQAKNARLAFEKSARIAGFFPGGDEDRLVMPFGNLPVHVPDVDSEFSEIDDVKPARGGGGVVRLDVPDLHPSIIGMLEELPAPKSKWSKEDQADWLQALAMMFRVIYKSEDRGSLTVSYSSQKN